MRAIVLGLFSLLSLNVFAQDGEIAEEFIPIDIEGKDAFMSTKTGEFTFRDHDKTDPTKLKTTANGVFYTNIKTHSVKKGQTLSIIAKQHGTSVSKLKADNKLKSNNLSIGDKLKILKTEAVKSSSPVISYSGEERIIAALRPGESPGQFAAPPSVQAVETKVIAVKKSVEKPAAKYYKAETSVKNPIFGLDQVEETEEDALDNLSKAIAKDLEAAKTEPKTVVVKTPKTKPETKAEKLAKLKAEMKALEEEIEQETPKPSTPIKEKVIVKKEVEKEAKREVMFFENKNEAPTVVIKEEKKVNTFKDKAVKTKKEVSKIVKNKEGKKVVVFENKSTKVISKTEKETKKVEAEAEAKQKETKPKQNELLYTVKKGNSLYYIATKYGMTVNALKKLNNITNNMLKVGQKLKVLPQKK